VLPLPERPPPQASRGQRLALWVLPELVVDLVPSLLPRLLLPERPRLPERLQPRA